MKIVCPCCNGIGEIEQKSPVQLTPMQFRIYDIVRRSPHGIEGPQLVDRVYADRADGGPDFASRSVHVQIKNMNERLAMAQENIHASSRGRGGLYRLYKNVV